MPKKKRPKLPADFDSWEECRDYWALEAIFRMQGADRNPSPRNEKLAKEASNRAIRANRYCEKPL